MDAIERLIEAAKAYGAYEAVPIGDKSHIEKEYREAKRNLKALISCAEPVYTIEQSDVAIFASFNEAERDNKYLEMSHQERIAHYKNERLPDMVKTSEQAWEKLDAIEKLALESVDCVLWLDKKYTMSKYSH